MNAATRSAAPQRAGKPVGPQTLLGLGTSLKPGLRRKSAAHALVSFALDSLAGVGADVAFVELHEHPVPFFDGRMPHEYASAELDFLGSCISSAGALLMAVPGYWSGVSGVWKNCIDTLCGPLYDLPRPGATIFDGKPVSLVVVGADEASAVAAAAQAPAVMASTGARLVGAPVVVANPRDGVAGAGNLSAELLELAVGLLRAMPFADAESKGRK